MAQTYTATATLKTCRNGTSWRGDFAKAGQGKYIANDTDQRVGYIGFEGMNLSNKSITRIVLTFTYGNAGIHDWASKTLGFYKWTENHLASRYYTAANELGTLSAKNQYSGTTSFTFDSSTNSTLFSNFKNYFESGNNVLIICRPNDQATKYAEFTDNYLLITEASISVEYTDTYNMDVNYKVNGELHYGGHDTAGTFTANVGGTTVAENVKDLNYRAVSEASYEITANPAPGWRFVNNSVTGTNKTVNGTYPSNDFSVVLDFRQEYTVTYNNGGGGTEPSNQTKVNGTALTLRNAMTRSETPLGGYTVSLVPQNGEDNSTLTATRTTSYTFRKWKSSAGTEYSGGGSYTIESATTMTAQWDSATVTSAVTLPTVTKPGYAFLGWSESSTATTGVTGTYVPQKDDVTLYAIWAPEGLVNIDNGSSFDPHTIWIDNGTSWDQYMAYIDTGTEWVLCNE